MKLIRSLAVAAALLGALAPVSAQDVSRRMAPSTAAEASRVLCATACLLSGFQVNSAGTAVYVMLFDATSAPDDGAVTPVKWYRLATESTGSAIWTDPMRMNTGAVLVCSSTGPFTKTASATCTFSGEIR